MTDRAQRLQAGLAQLAEAYEYAQDRQCNPWEFALGIEPLAALGMTRSGLRWLVSKGYVEHACEVTTARDVVRRFRPGRNLAFPKKTCFLLTDAGALFAATVLGEPEVLTLPRIRRGDDLSWRPTDQPQWDARRRTLRVGPCMVKEYRRPSPSQEAILAAFEEEGWPDRIDDPLSPQVDQDPKCRLHDTIKRLNRHHQQRLIHFQGDGTGEGICWAFVDAASVALAATAAARPQKENMRRAA